MAVNSLSTERPIDRVLSQLQAVKRYSRGYLARCPAHHDRNPSLMLWEDHADQHVGLKCYAGCSRKAIVEAVGLTEPDLYVQAGPRLLPDSSEGICLIDLALDKQLHPALLINLGLTDCTYHGRSAVRIPYYTREGKEYARSRIRTHLVAKEGSRWSNGEDPLIPYGLHRLSEARHAGYVVIVEGESDCWTLWQHGFPALGLPGARTETTLILDYLSGIERVYVMQEPDEAGKKLPQTVAKRLKEVGYTGKVYALSLAADHGAKDPNALHKRERSAFKETFQHALNRARPPISEGAAVSLPSTLTVKELMSKVLPPVKWAIPDILPEGLTLLCGKPKLGKSWLSLGFALGISSGGYVLGKIPVEQGEVLCLMLEDTERRLQKRVDQVAQTMHGLPDGLHFALSWPRLDQGGKEQLEAWLSQHPATRLVVVDTWAKLSPRPHGQKRSMYEEDYDALTPLKAIADKYGIAILAVHHLRKMGAADVLDEVSGSTGLTGAVDGFLVLKKEQRESFGAMLTVLGRDIEETRSLALTQDTVFATWTVAGDASEFAKTKERQAIIDLLRASPEGLSAKELASQLQKNYNTIRNLLAKLIKEGHIIHEGIHYRVISVVNVINRSQCSQRNQSEHSNGLTTRSTAVTAAEHSISIVSTEQPLEQTESRSDYSDYSDYGNYTDCADALHATTKSSSSKREECKNAAPSTDHESYTDYSDYDNSIDHPVHRLDAEQYDYTGKDTHASQHECCTVYEGRKRTRLHQRRGVLIQDTCGYWWCEQCQAQRDLMNWGALHHFPSLHAGVCTMEQGRDAWLRFCQMEGFLAVQQLLAGLPAE